VSGRGYSSNAGRLLCVEQFWLHVEVHGVGFNRLRVVLNRVSVGRVVRSSFELERGRPGAALALAASRVLVSPRP